MEKLQEIPRYKFYDTSWKNQERGTYYGYRKDGNPVDMKTVNGEHFTIRMGEDKKPMRVKSIVEYDTDTSI